MASRPPRRPGYKTRAERFAEQYDRWSVPLTDEPDGPEMTALHDGLDWVEIHAPRQFFEELAEQVEAGDTDGLMKWLAVWAMARKEPNPFLCGAPTRRGNPCHHERPCRHHPHCRRPQ